MRINDTNYVNPHRNIHLTVKQIKATIQKMKSTSTRQGDRYTISGINWQIVVSNPTKAVKKYVINRGSKGDVHISYDRPNNTFFITSSTKELF